MKYLNERQKISWIMKLKYSAPKRFSKIQGFLRLVKKAPPYPSKLFHGQNGAQDDLNKAQHSNQFFHNVFSSQTKNTHQQFPKKIHNIIPCTRGQISCILQKLDISKSKYQDGIGNLILKHFSNSLSFSLHSIFKTCLNK